MIRVPYGMTVHGEEEINAVVNVLRTSTQMGKNVRAMESKVAKLFDKKHGVMVNSGSSALYIAMEALDLPKGSEVITPALTFSTTVGCIVKNDLVPVFVDCEPATFLIDIEQMEAKITDKTSALVIPNLLGNIPDWKRISEIAKKHDLKILEDSADTLGGEVNGESSGKYSDISITSFYGSHVINCGGNGGMLCLNDDKLTERALLLRSWGRSSSLFVESENIENRFNVEVDGIPYDSKFVFSDIGYNLEPSEMGAAFGLVQLDKLQKNIDLRESHFNEMRELFSQFTKLVDLPEQTPNTRTGWLAFPFIIKEGAPFSRREMQIFLEKQNIQTRVIFTGNITRQPGFKNLNFIGNSDDYVNADNVMKNGVLVACHHGLTREMINHLKAKITEFLAQYN